LIQLADHEQQVATITDRTSVDQVAAAFDELRPNLERSSTIAIQLMSIGRLQSTHDRLVALHRDLLATESSNSAGTLQQTERNRAYQETEQLLSVVNSELRQVEDKIENQRKTGRVNPNTFAKELSSVYSGLSQTISYLNELMSN